MTQFEDEFLPGKSVDRFELLELLGQGGMGLVFKARDKLMDRIVALKVLNKSRLSDDIARARFEREGKIVSSLSHENIVVFYAVGISKNDCPFIAMEYMEGETLRGLLNRDGSLTWNRAVRIALQIASALTYAHEKGIVHRDLKPENVFLISTQSGEFTVKVLDFGIARIMPEKGAELQTLTSTGQLLGSYLYMAPETFTGKKADHRADIYSLACILFECICGQSLLQAETALEAAAQHGNLSERSIQKRLQEHGAPKALALSIAKALKTDPDLRYADVGELKNQLQEIVSGGMTDNSSNPFKARSLVWLLSALGLIALLISGTLLYKNTLEKNLDSPEFRKAAPMKERSLNDIQLFIKSGLKGPLPLASIESALQSPVITPLERGELHYLESCFYKTKKEKILDRIIALLKSKEELSSYPINAYPGKIKLDTLICLGMLLNKELDYPYTASLALKEFIELFPSVPRADRVRYRDGFQTLELNCGKTYLAEILLDTGRTKESIELVKSVPFESEFPLLEQFVILWKAGAKEEADRRAEKPQSDTTSFLAIAHNLLLLGDLSETEKILSKAKVIPSESNERNEEEFFQLLVKLKVEQGKNKEAIELLKKRANEYIGAKDSERSMTVAITPFLISYLSYLGAQAEADRLFSRFKSMNLPRNESALLQDIEKVLSALPSDPEQRIIYLSVKSLNEVDPDKKLFYCSTARNWMSSKTRAETRIGCLEPLRVVLSVYHPREELRVSQLIQQEQNTLIQKPPVLAESPNEESDQPDYSKFIPIRIIELLIALDRTKEAIPLVEKIEASKPDAKELLRLFHIELQLKRFDRAESLINESNNSNCLVGMSKSSRRIGNFDLSRKAISKSALFASTKRQSFSVTCERAKIELEQGNFALAREILEGMNFPTVEAQLGIEERKRLEILRLLLKMDSKSSALNRTIKTE